MHRHLAADPGRRARVIVGVHRADNREGIGFAIVAIVWIQSDDAGQFGAEILSHSLDVARGDLGRVQLGFRRKNIAVGRIADHLGDRIGEIGGRRVDEEIPVRVVLVRGFPEPGKFKRSESQGHYGSRLTNRLVFSLSGA